MHASLRFEDLVDCPISGELEDWIGNVIV